MTVVLKNENGEVLLENLKEAQGFYGRFKGLMGKTSMPNHEGLRITPCNSIHCFFMKMNIDVLFLDEDLCVVHTIFDMKPWRISKVVKDSRSVIETKSGVLKDRVCTGDCLSVED